MVCIIIYHNIVGDKSSNHLLDHLPLPCNDVNACVDVHRIYIYIVVRENVVWGC